ncbi:thermonuclease family protein [Sphingobium yanoikuyae]|uniref:Thermonuclease family protein n=5 Tax=Sphingomonadales TaxID=204457 RepID=A0AA42X294_SPHYA|nr:MULTISPECIES: thermonuclease family protein [Sphingomonadaceae]MDH2134756.1 thermonuclease family protein [Sphingobium yanoikuyae]MDH2151217.1 thermonuclease family protein [Sphingobium yanoikuyae]MDH2169492.1 thermonuclease family protein [Sphingobium yanoikuyae]
MKLFPGVPPYQRWMMGATFVVVAVYSIAQNKASLVEASQTQLSSPSPRIIDGDTVDFSNGRVRIVGIDAPDDDRPQLKALASEALRELAARDGGLTCSASLFDYALRREEQCRTTAKSYGRLNLSCRFPSNKASVGATMVAQGYAVDYRVYSGGAYVDLMRKAAAQRAGLWGVDYEGMRQLAVQRAQVSQGCDVGTIKKEPGAVAGAGSTR